jgi:hypothetical protein
MGNVMNRLTQPNLEPVSAFDCRSAVEEARHFSPRNSGLCQPASGLSQLSAIVLLGGAVGPSAFRAALDRAIVDLPVEAGHTVLTQWQDQCASLAQSIPSDSLPVRLLVDHSAQLPQVRGRHHATLNFSVERDPSEFRGTGGLLRDIAHVYSDDDYLLVANAVQLLREPLTVLADDLFAQSAPVVVVSHADRTPSGIMLVRSGCLREIPEIGFVDMKEQGLGMIARCHTVKVLERSKPTALPIRTYVNYLAALRQIHRPSDSQAKLEDWESCFAIVEEGAEVAAGSTVHDSVVLRGGRVEKGAVVINSVVCAGGVVRKGQIVTDELVKGQGRR